MKTYYIHKYLQKTLYILFLCVMIAVLFVSASDIAYGETDALNLTSSSAILIEASTGQVIYEKNSTATVAPASITKIMTLLLIFDELNSGSISLDDEVTVSEHAASMGGSQVYLEAGEVQTVDTMIKCIAVASANDACVSMAEFIGGTEDMFVEMMNQRAKGLGMENTHFVNSCGLDTENHVSSARDVAVMSRELITKYPDIHNYSTIWMDTITHTTSRGESEFGLTNTNKLIKQYQWATGLKTGSTSKAGCCLSATASKDGVDLIAVIMTAPDSKTRFSEAVSLLNYGFANCYIYRDEDVYGTENVPVSGGTKDYASGTYEKTFSYMFMKKPDTDKITKSIQLRQDLTAPLCEGEIIGEIVYEYDSKEIGRVNIVAGESVSKARFADKFRQVFGNFLNY